MNYKKHPNKQHRYSNAGFTLVEMIVVLTIMAIMMSAAVWGVTGWISHYEYISCEEKARTIYMGAQSALSAADSRGTLDECMSGLEKEMKSKGTIFAQADSGVGLSKSDYGIPTKKDNEGIEHEYGYLMVNKGDFSDASKRDNNPLFKLLDTYVSDSEQLNGSIVVEFDITAKKVYSAFYSSWATSMDYSDTDSVVRGGFHITVDRRKPSYREEYAVGYYSADQVNVVKIEPGQQLKVLNCELHNEETLYLTMNSTSLNGDADTSFYVELYETTKLYNSFGDSFTQFANNVFGAENTGTDNEVLLCSFTVSRDVLGPYVNTPQKIDIDVKDAEGNALGRFPFLVSFDTGVGEDGEEMNVLNITLDALTTDQSLALASTGVDEEGRTAGTSYSITRLIGVKPRNIFARVSVEAKDSDTVYVTGSSVDSNKENDLFKTKEKDSENIADDNIYEISRCRHLANIRYTENYTVINGVEHTYALMEDINWVDGIIYNTILGKTDDSESGDIAYKSLDTTKTGFPMIPKLNEKSMFDGKGNQITSIVLNNESSVDYDRNADGTLVNPNSTVNNSKVLGLFGINYGTIRRTIISASKVTALTAEESAAAGGSSDVSVFSDTLEAVGLLCGRNEGYLRELYFDKDCVVDASVSVNYDDVAEAKAAGVSAPETDDNLIEKYGCGVGMVAGTIQIKENAVYDRIRTSGKVTGRLNGVTETPLITDTEARNDLYNDTVKDSFGRTRAENYAYGVGGIFGYAYGEYNGAATRLGIGISETEVAANINKRSDEDGGYLTMNKRTVSEKTETDDEGNEITVSELSKSDENLFAGWNNMSIVNKADVSGDSFTGGIVGNIYITGLKSRKSEITDEEGDRKIPDNAVAQLINCHNYGDTTGKDYIGGVVGVNGEGGYITECVSYGSPEATGGVSAGIASENYGYISKCSLERALADEDNDNKNYIPRISGNMEVAGAITSVNQKDCIILDCRCAVKSLEDVNNNIVIAGDEMNTFGYLVGENFGVVNGGKSGDYIGYDSKKTKMTIGGAVGTNYEVVKNVTVTSELVDDGEAECIGGIAGLNLKKIKNCKFGGSISKSKGVSRDIAIGGIAGRNGNADTAGEISGCYLVGARFNVTGVCNYVESDSEASKISKSSAVGGISGINYALSTINQCYITSLGEVNSDGNAAVDDDNNYKVKRKSSLIVKYGMAGGVTAVNYGTISNCGYTDKVFYEKDDLFEVTADTKASGSDMSLLTRAKVYLDILKPLKSADGKVIDDTVSDEVREAVDDLNEIFIDDSTGELRDDVRNLCGYLSNDEDNYLYALPKKEADDGEMHWDAYSSGTDHFMLSMTEGKGSIGGIAGYNTKSGCITDCASGRWVVENYLPKATYNATGGVIGTNAAEGTQVHDLMNLAYVRVELPIVKKEFIKEDTGQADNNGPDNRFYYMGGVIGTQDNTTKTEWTIEKCINAGTVLSYYGNNAGGVLGQVSGMGGKVQFCYNYGMLMTGYTTTLNGSNSGTAGGIVSHYTKLEADQVNEVLHCQNHGIVSFPMQGVDFKTSKIYSAWGRLAANDVGGVVGEISAPVSTTLYTVNIKDCVNGKNARTYCGSKCAGIVGQIGCFTRGNVSSQTAVNSIFVNIDSCRNYSSQLWSAYGNIPKNNKIYSMTGGGITAGRDAYSKSVRITGYTTIRNCLSVRMNGIDSNGNYKDPATTDNNGILAYAKQNSPMNADPYLHTLKYCGNNYYLDESSFQYSTKRGRILATGYDEKATKNDNTMKNDSGKVNAIVSDGEPENKSTIAYSDKVTLFDGRTNDLSKYMDDYTKQRLASHRIITVAYGRGDNQKYALFAEPKGYSVDNLNENNAWIADGKLHINAETEEIICPLIYYGFNETTSSAPYNIDFANHFYLERLKRYDSFRTTAEQTYGSVDSKLNASRLPITDEYDMDYYDLDNDYMAYIKEYKATGPDLIENVNVKKDETYGYYDVTWDVVSSEAGENPSATEFDVEIKYIELEPNVTFNFDDIQTYLTNNIVTLESNKNPKTAYGTTTTFSTPNDLEMKEGYTYYALVRVKDSRGTRDEDYSIYMNIPEVKDPDTGDVITEKLESFVELEPKLPTPVFEIVKYTTRKTDGTYESKWMLHLKNPEKFEYYAKNYDEFEVGAYSLTGSHAIDTNKLVKMNKDYIIDSSGNLITDGLLNNAIDASKLATNKMDYELYGYAKAKNCLDSDLYKFTVYIPSRVNPTVDYTWTEPDDALLNNAKKKPEYSGNLTYTKFDTTSVNTIPPTPQTFKLELYGVKVEKNQYGEITKRWHETVASKEYTVAENETIENINIGYYDVPSNVNLSDYDSFGVDCWYAASGQGDVFNYFETTEERAKETVRGSGYITDLSSGTPVYYFHTAKLAAPKIELVCMGRTPEWYAVLTNGYEYGPETKIALNGNQDSNVIINTSNPGNTENTVVNKLFEYAAKINAGWSGRWFVAKHDGCLDSDRVNLSPTNNSVFATTENNLRNNLYVNFGADCDTYNAIKDDETVKEAEESGDLVSDEEVPGAFTLDKDNNLTFMGTIHYSSRDSIWQYYRYELYATDEKGQQVTLRLSDDEQMVKGRGSNNGYKTDRSVKIVIKGDDENIDISKYHDFRFAVWYSKSEVNERESDEGYYFYHYAEIPESVAKSFECYDPEKDVFNNARGNGLLIDYSKLDKENGVTKPTYYYVTALADKTYGDTTYTNNYKNYVLYRETEETISTLAKNEDGTDAISESGETIKYVNWTMNSNYYNTDILCDVNVTVYQYPADAAKPTLATLNEDYYFYNVIDQASSPYRVGESDDHTFDWDTYKYYAVVKVKDAGIESEKAYSSSIVVEMSKPLPTPQMSFIAMGWDGDYIHLDNYEDYADCTGKVEIIVTYAAGNLANKTYVIDVNGGSYSWRTTKSGVPIRYSTKDKMDKNPLTDGSSFKYVAYAQEKDPVTGEVVNKSARDFSKKIYVPDAGSPAPDGTKITLANTSVSVNDDRSEVTFTSDITFTCNTAKAPKDTQGFTVALVGTPKTNVNGSKKPAILSRTSDKGVQLKAGESVTGAEYKFKLADDVNLDDFKDLYIYIWYADHGADGYVYPEAKLTDEEFEKYKDKEGVVVDCTDGISKAKYFFERVFGYNDEKPNEAGTNRGSVKYKITLD